MYRNLDFCVRPLRGGGLAEYLFERFAPFVFVERAADPVEAVVGVSLDGHGIGYYFDNPRFGDAAVEPLAELDVHFGGAVSVVENDEGRGFAYDKGRFEDAGGFFDGIAGIHRAIFSHVVFQKPTESPLAHPVKASRGRRRNEENVSHGLKDRYLSGVVNRFFALF